MMNEGRVYSLPVDFAAIQNRLFSSRLSSCTKMPLPPTTKRTNTPFSGWLLNMLVFL
jgi:hypothetical protein